MNMNENGIVVILKTPRIAKFKILKMMMATIAKAIKRMATSNRRGVKINKLIRATIPAIKLVITV